MRNEEVASKDSSSKIRKTSHYTTKVVIVVLLCFFYLIFISKTEQPRLRPPAIYGEKSIKAVRQELIYRPDLEATHTLPTLNPKIIIWWTLSFHKLVHFKDKIQKEYTCGKYKCIYTANRSQLSQSAAVMFTNGYVKRDDLPRKKTPGQRWILVNHESPVNTRLHSFLSGKINWTLTYHRSSDILYPYGFYKRRGSDIIYPYEVSILFVASVPHGSYLCIFPMFADIRVFPFLVLNLTRLGELD